MWLNGLAQGRLRDVSLRVKSFQVPWKSRLEPRRAIPASILDADSEDDLSPISSDKQKQRTKGLRKNNLPVYG
jgi:hypothetical protein